MFHIESGLLGFKLKVYETRIWLSAEIIKYSDSLQYWDFKFSIQDKYEYFSMAYISKKYPKWSWKYSKSLKSGQNFWPTVLIIIMGFVRFRVYVESSPENQESIFLKCSKICFFLSCFENSQLNNVIGNGFRWIIINLLCFELCLSLKKTFSLVQRCLAP